jgi:hypothetical protein
MTTQTRRTIRRSARFFRTTVTASLVTACCGLILWSAGAAYAAAVSNGMPYNGMPYNGTPIQGMPMQGMPVNGIPRNGLPAQDVLSTGSVVHAPTLPAVPQEGLPWHSLSQRPLGAAAVLSGSDDHRALPVELPDIR